MGTRGLLGAAFNHSIFNVSGPAGLDGDSEVSGIGNIVGSNDLSRVSGLSGMPEAGCANDVRNSDANTTVLFDDIYSGVFSVFKQPISLPNQLARHRHLHQPRVDDKIKLYFANITYFPSKANHFLSDS